METKTDAVGVGSAGVGVGRDATALGEPFALRGGTAPPGLEQREP